MIEAPGIVVNGIKITPDQINTEVQYHPANDLPSAKYEAMKALVVRELLIQRAVELELCDHDEAIKNPDDILETLFEKEIHTPDVDKETCERFYTQNKGRFYTSPLFEASHILYPIKPSDDESRKESLKMAQDALNRIQDKQESFKAIAKVESACSSKEQGGHLGQLVKGQTTPAFESALFAMKEGEISIEPLLSEFGYHIIKVHKRLEGEQLPFDAVHEWVEDYLKTQSWQRAFSQYIQLLAGQAEVSGFQLKQADSPLVQ